MSTKRAESEVIWLLQEADGDACGLRATSWNHLAEIDEREKAQVGTSGAKRQGYYPRDYYPEHAQRCRGRLRRTHAAWVVLPAWAQAVLQARYLPRGRYQAQVPGLGEWTWVAQLFVSVRLKSDAERTTPFAYLREVANKASNAALIETCKAVTEEALQLYADALQAGEEERERDKSRLRAQHERERYGRAA